MKHRIVFKYIDEVDDDAIDLAFNKKKADMRKEWLKLLMLILLLIILLSN